MAKMPVDIEIMKQKRIDWLNKLKNGWPEDFDSFHNEACQLFGQLNSQPTLYNLSVLGTVKQAGQQPGSSQAAVSALRCLQRMAFNLLQFPWKAQLATVSGSSGFAVHQLQRLPGHAELLAAMGYSLNSDGDFKLTQQLDESSLQVLFVDLVAAELTLPKLLASSTSLANATPRVTDVGPQVVAQRNFAFGRGQSQPFSGSSTISDRGRVNPALPQMTDISLTSSRSVPFGRGRAQSGAVPSDCRSPGTVGRLCNSCKKIQYIRLHQATVEFCICGAELPISERDGQPIYTYL